MSAQPHSPRVMKSSIAICGTGIAGLACALALARRGESVTLLGPKHPIAAADPEMFHPRVYAISPASQTFLSSIGVWDLLPASRLTAIEAMEIYGDGHGHLNLRAWQNAMPELAWIVEAAEIERVLIQALQFVGVPWITEKCVGYRPGRSPPSLVRSLRRTWSWQQTVRNPLCVRRQVCLLIFSPMV